MNFTSISVFSVGSYCQSAAMSQDSTSRECGSQDNTLPQSQVLPSSPRSYQRPPTRGSITASTALALPILYSPSGHHVPIFSVKTRHATSGGACTLTTLRTLFGSIVLDFACSIGMVSSPWLLPARPPT